MVLIAEMTTRKLKAFHIGVDFKTLQYLKLKKTKTARYSKFFFFLEQYT